MPKAHLQIYSLTLHSRMNCNEAAKTLMDTGFVTVHRYNYFVTRLFSKSLETLEQ